MQIDIVMISKLGNGDGGRETWLKNFLLETSRKNIDCVFNLLTLRKAEDNVLQCLGDNNMLGAQLEFDTKSKFLPTSLAFFIKFIFSLLLKKKPADFVIGVGGLAEAMAIVMCYFWPTFKGKRILWLRTIYTKEKGYRLNKFSQKILLALEIFIIKKFFTVVIANGEDTAQFYRAHGIECTVINNAVNLNVWTNLQKSPAPRFRVAFVGRLSAVKGIEAFLESIEIFTRKNPYHEIEFHVVGAGPFEDQVQSLQRRGLLQYHGMLANNLIPEFLTNTDCCVALTYLKDFMGGGGVSNALIEQMAAEQVIIAWNNDIFNKVLTHKTAYLVEQDDIEGLANSYTAILNNIETAQVKAVAARNESKNFSISKHVDLFFKAI